jgi:hypothetical protein
MTVPGSVELSPVIDPGIKASLEALKLTAEERAETSANSMWGMYNFTALRALILAGGDWEKANEICIEVEKMIVAFSALEAFNDHEPGDPAEVAFDRPLERSGLRGVFLANRDARNAAIADFMVLENTYPNATYEIVRWGPDDATYRICGRCPRKDSLDTVNDVSARRGMTSPLEGYDLFAICAGGAEGYERVLPGVKGEGLKGMCKGDGHCEFRYYREP